MAKRGRRSAISAYHAEIGRKGGRAKVPKGAAAWSKEERSERATKAINARWEAYYRDHPEKRRPAKGRRTS